MEVKSVDLKVEGLTCNNCATTLSRYLQKQGFSEVQVNYATGEVHFKPINGQVSLEQVKAGIHRMGYQVVAEDAKEPWWTLQKKLWISALFTLPLLMGHLLMLGGLTFLGSPYLQLLFCIPVFLIGLEHFGRSAFRSILAREPNMDVLIFTGSTAAFVYSLIGTLIGESDYIFYETSATIITLVLLGNLIEHRAVAKTTSAIEELGRLKVGQARKVMPSGLILLVDNDQVQVGDTLQVNEGDAVPTDAVVLKGSASVDESMFSGESIPVEKKSGASLIGGSIVKSGHLLIQAQAIGKDTVLQQMIALVKGAQFEKPSVQRLADRISAIFVPIVLLIAFATLIISHFAFQVPFAEALMRSIAVLVISCPCAMGLATPTAIMVGVGRVAKNGILIKGGQTLETFAGIKYLVFDKTGTLTTGAFQVASINYYDSDHSMINAIIYTMEKHSSHPIARSLVRELSTWPAINTVELIEIQEHQGSGMAAKDRQGNQYRLGSYQIASGVTADNTHAVYLLKNDQLLATLDLKDEIKPQSQATIDYVKAKGILPILLSGDREPKVKQVAGQLGISRYYAEKWPGEKLKLIEQLSKEGPTAMVGDGINDAPALARATIGVSLSDASQIAIQSAEIVLLNGRLDHLRKAIAISKGTLTTIKQNLFWAFSYNLVAIPIAALGFLNPMLGALFMAFSDVIVIGNSLRLRNRKLDDNAPSKVSTS